MPDLRGNRNTVHSGVISLIPHDSNSAFPEELTEHYKLVGAIRTKSAALHGPEHARLVVDPFDCW